MAERYILRKVRSLKLLGFKKGELNRVILIYPNDDINDLYFNTPYVNTVTGNTKVFKEDVQKLILKKKK